MFECIKSFIEQHGLRGYLISTTGIHLVYKGYYENLYCSTFEINQVHYTSRKKKEN